MVQAKSLTRRVFTLAIAAMALAACASGPTIKDTLGELPGPPAGHARIYFYRTAIPFLVAVQPDIIVNSKKVGTSTFGAVFYRDALPGRYEVFLTSDKDNPLSLTAVAGQSYFVKTVVGLGISGSKLVAEMVEEERAQQEVKEMTLVDPSTVK